MNLRPLNFNLETQLKLSEPIPENLLKTRKSGGTELTYIAHNTAIDKLNDMFGFAWSFEIIDQWMQDSPPHIKKENPKYPFTANNSDPQQIKIDGEGKKYLELPQLPVCWCKVKLTVPMETDNGNIIYISKMAFGSACVTGNQNTQSMSGFKAAQSDALKKAASLFGIALELYRDSNEQAEFDLFRESLIPDVWTDEVKQQYNKQFSVLTQILEDFGWSFEDLSYYVSLVTENRYSNFMKMPTEYIDELIQAIQEDGE